MQTATSGLTLRAAHLSQQRNSGPPLPQRDAIIGLGRLFPSQNPPFRNEHSETLFTCRHLWRSTSALPTVHSTAWVYWVMAIWRLISCRPNEILSALASRGGVGLGVVGGLTDSDELHVKNANDTMLLCQSSTYNFSTTAFKVTSHQWDEPTPREREKERAFNAARLHLHNLKLKANDFESNLINEPR